ncbi:hypothetical protein F5884DRAFT_632365, partial [Xylogone sp. PMI_703]
PTQVEHNIKPPASTTRPSRRPDMTSFVSALSEITTTSTPSHPHNNPHAVPTPADMSTLAHLLQDQFTVLLQNSSTSQSSQDPSQSPPPNAALLETLITAIQSTIDSPPDELKGVPQSFLDSLDRVPKKDLKKEDTCPICAERFLDDEFPLVVVLPCHERHWFDLECVGPWLLVQGTCPLDRKEVGKRRE